MNNDERVTTSINIKKSIRDRLAFESGRYGISAILEELAVKWLNHEIDITIGRKSDQVMKDKE